MPHLAQVLSDEEAFAALATAEGRMFVDGVRFHLRAESIRNSLNDRLERRLARVVRRLEADAVRIIARVPGDQTQAFASARSFKLWQIRVRRELVKVARQLRDNQASGMRSSISRRGGLLRTRIAGVRVRGLTVTELWQQWAASVGRRLRSAVSLSLAEGGQVAAVAQVRAALKRAAVDARAVARTVHSHVLARSRESWIASQGFRLVRYVAILDDRTTEICQRLAGRVFALNEGPRPPQHFRCRSFVVPATSRSRTLGLVTPRQFTEFTGVPLAA